ncbi:putative tRNA acetyltransferase [Martiniozyma asiatica (nom. inval.)]|nr:putative tRNA acetyltransferase [Martiniozyma asiatica]
MAQKRSKSNQGSSKRQRQSDMIQPGEYGIYATCPRRKEPQAAKDLKMIFQEALEKYYPDALIADADGTADADSNADDNVNADSHGLQKEIDVEDEIAKELQQMKKESSRHNKQAIFREIKLNAESLTFFKFKSPIIPSEIVYKICKELLESGEKKGRFVQRMVAIDKSCISTQEEWEKMMSEYIDNWLLKLDITKEEGKDNSENEADTNAQDETEVEDTREFKTFGINLTRRNFEAFSREQIEDSVKSHMAKYNLRHTYRSPDLMVNVYCFKNNMGISTCTNKSFENLCKFNLQMIFDKATGQVTALGREGVKLGRPEQE